MDKFASKALPTCKKCLRKENFLFEHDRPGDFVHLAFCKSAILYAVLATCICIHSVVMAIYSGLASSYHEKILIWLTYWSYYALTARFLLTTVNCWRNVYRRQSSPRLLSMPLMYKAQWVLQSISTNAAVTVTILYWFIMYSGRKEGFISINSHGLNTILVLLDLVLSRAIVRVHHCVYPMTFMLTYSIFSIIYWAAGGTNDDGHNYIYNLLDYSNQPTKAAIVVLIVAFVAVPMLHLVLYGIFRLRMWIVYKLQQGSETISKQKKDLKGLDLESDTCKGTKKEKDLVQTTILSGETSYVTAEHEEEVTELVHLEMEDIVRPVLCSNHSQVSCTSTTALLNNNS